MFDLIRIRTRLYTQIEGETDVFSVCYYLVCFFTNISLQSSNASLVDGTCLNTVNDSVIILSGHLITKIVQALKPESSSSHKAGT